MLGLELGITPALHNPIAPASLMLGREGYEGQAALPAASHEPFSIAVHEEVQSTGPA